MDVANLNIEHIFLNCRCSNNCK